MSRIVEKIFDKSKKIIRGIFKGSPNLITTSDLNRQIEALKYQMDSIDDRIGFISDIQISSVISKGNLQVSFDYKYLETKGCSFLPNKDIMSINFTQSSPLVYVCLLADVKEITYEEDTRHDISGATFLDGTSQPAANHLVYTNERIILTHSPSEISNLVGIVAIIELINGSAIIRKNFLERGKFFGVDKQNERLYQIKAMDFVNNIFYIPNDISIVEGDIVEITILGHVGNDIDGFDLNVDVKVSLTNGNENGLYSSPFYVIPLKVTEVSLTYYNVIVNLKDKTILVVTQNASRFSRVDKAFIKLYKSSDF